jgi:hypothetical protein
MKKFSILLLISTFILSFNTGHSQKLKSGETDVLKGQKLVNIKFTYSGMEVGKFKSEDEYISKGTADRNSKKPGTGDVWAAKWQSDKSERYQPGFIESFNNSADGCGIEVKEDAGDAKYTFIVRTTFLEQGVETVVFGAAKSASVNLEIDLVETASQDKVIATIESNGNKPKSNARVTVDGVPVNKEVYDAGARITECYESAGKSVGKFICKGIK